MKKRVVVAITGASGSIYGIRALEMLRDLDLETHVIISKAAETTIQIETGRSINEIQALADEYYDEMNLCAPIASGSFQFYGMVVAPCSIKTLSAIANCYTQNLIARAADVSLKEGRHLILMIRETPLHRGHIHILDMAARSGAIIYPPVPALYTKAQSIDDMVTNTVGRMLNRIGIENSNFTPWS